MIDTMVYVKSALIGWFSLQWNPFNRVTNGPKNLAVLTGDCINEGFLQENVWQFCGVPKKKYGCINEVTVLRGGCIRQSSTVPVSQMSWA